MNPRQQSWVVLAPNKRCDLRKNCDVPFPISSLAALGEKPTQTLFRFGEKCAINIKFRPRAQNEPAFDVLGASPPLHTRLNHVIKEFFLVAMGNRYLKSLPKNKCHRL